MRSCSFFFCILPYIIKFQSQQKVDNVVYTLPIYCVSTGGIIVAYIRDLCANILLTSTNQDIAKYILCTRCCNVPKMTMNHNISFDMLQSMVALSWSTKYFLEFYSVVSFLNSPEKFAGTIHHLKYTCEYTLDFRSR